MGLVKDKYSVQISRFNNGGDYDFHLCSLRMKAVPRGKKIVHAILDDGVSTDISEEALSLIISALANKPLRAVQSCSTAEDAWEKLQSGYAGKAFYNKVGVLNGILNLNFKRKLKTGDHLSKLQTSFSRLAAMSHPVPESTQVAIFVSSLSNVP